jgi:hypothetical protein
MHRCERGKRNEARAETARLARELEATRPVYVLSERMMEAAVKEPLARAAERIVELEAEIAKLQKERDEDIRRITWVIATDDAWGETHGRTAPVDADRVYLETWRQQVDGNQAKARKKSVEKASAAENGAVGKGDT